MPYAKIDVSFIRDHFAVVPEKDRAAAIALYTQLVLTSAELLLDGYLPRGVLEAGGAQVGISRGRYARREIASAATSLRKIALLEDAKDGGSQLTKWHEHHSSRSDVENARTRAAERKRKSRGQLTIDVSPSRSQRDDREPSQRDNGVTRARMRAGGQTHTHTNPSSSEGPGRPGDDDDLALRADLESLGVNDPALIAAALTDQARAAAWIDHATEHADRNAAGYFRTNFTTGAWPPNGNGKHRVDPAERRDRFLTTSGYLLPDDELEYQLRNTYDASDDDVIEALDRAADLRRNVST